ncbi:hypothetical protein [Dokdonella sp.]
MHLATYFTNGRMLQCDMLGAGSKADAGAAEAAMLREPGLHERPLAG